MAVLTKLSNVAVNAGAAAWADLLDGGYLRMYGGGAGRPATVDTAITDQTQLAELRFATPSESGIVDGVITFTALVADADADATGTAAWFRCFKSDGVTAILDGNIATSAADIVMPTVAIQQHAEVSLSSFTLTMPKA